VQKVVYILSIYTNLVLSMSVYVFLAAEVVYDDKMCAVENAMMAAMPCFWQMSTDISH